MKKIPEKHNEIEYPEVTAFDVVREFWHSMRGGLVYFFIIIVGSIVSSVAGGVIIPVYYKKFFDTLAKAQDKSIGAPELVHVILIVFGLNVIAWAAFRLATWANTPFQTQAMADLRERAFNYMIGHSHSFFTNNFNGSLVQRINRFSRAFESLADQFLWYFMPLLIRIVGITVVLWFISHTIVYIIYVWISLFVMSSYIFARWKLKYDVESAEIDSRSTAVLSDAISNQNTVQLFSGFAAESARFKEVNREQASMNTFRWNMDSTINAIHAFLNFTIEFFIFYYAIHYWQFGFVSIGTFALIQAYLIGLGDTLWSSTRVIRDVYQSFADAKEMVEIMHLPHEIKDIPHAQALAVTEGKVNFKDISFQFNENRMIFEDFNLAVPGGEKVALIGPSGAGKSSFVKLILRLYDLNAGEILIDGQSISQVTQKSLRDQVSLVPQDPILFHRTLMENIRYGKRDATDGEVLRAAKLAHCEEFIDSLPKKYETYVGERGVKLSGGERQRIAIARAILKNAPILILDEATSSLDSNSEHLIQDALENLMKGKTTFVIAHRLSTIKKMDRIVVLDHGKIIEDGSHDSLLAANGLYAKLWSLQAGGFIKAEGEEDAPAETDENSDEEDGE